MCTPFKRSFDWGKSLSFRYRTTNQKWNVSPNFLTKEDDINVANSAKKEDREKEVIIQELPIQLAPSQRKTARNAPCPCKSGKKYKRCCGKDEN